MRKIIIIMAMMLCCVVAKGQEFEYEVVKDTIFQNSGWPENICFVKLSNFDTNNKKEWWFTQTGDSIIKTMIDKFEYPIVIRNVYSKNWHDVFEIETDHYTEYYFYDYYTINNKLYFIYKIRDHYIYNTLFTTNISDSDAYNSFYSTEFNNNIKREPMKHDSYKLKGNIMFIYE